jgi:hypothetical protein
MHKTIKLISALIFLPVALHTQAEQLSGIDQLTRQQNIGCSAELRSLADSTLKQNPYRILGYNEQNKDIHLFNALAVTSHRDRDSHVSFYAIKNADGSCDTSITESYVLQTTCNDARNEAFSKWDLKGKFNERTVVLASKRIPGKEAFLTSQFATLCLVTTRQVINN